jgi:steroid delta-isomerase-like uncharacterized protein
MTKLDDNKAVTNRFHSLAEDTDLSVAATLLADNFKGYVTGAAGVMDRDTFRKMGEGFHASFSQFKTTVTAQIAEGDWVATYGVWSAVHTGVFNGIPASGKPIAVDMAFFDRIENGKIVEERTVMDLMGLLAQIGAIPAAAAA